jgi:hypothetical protein
MRLTPLVIRRIRLVYKGRLGYLISAEPYWSRTLSPLRPRCKHLPSGGEEMNKLYVLQCPTTFVAVSGAVTAVEHRQKLAWNVWEVSLKCQ